MNNNGKMKEAVNFQHLAHLLSERAAISVQEAEAFLKELFSAIPEFLSEENPVNIKDFGTFTLTRKEVEEEKNGGDNTKREAYKHLQLRFLPATALKELVNTPFSPFEKVLVNEGVSFEDLPIVTENKESESTKDILIAVKYKNAPEKIDRPTPSKTKAKRKSRKRPIARWIPLLGAAAVVTAILFFMQKQKNCNR